MSDARRTRTITGSMLLAASAALPAAGQEPVPASPPAAVSEIAAAPSPLVPAQTIELPASQYSGYAPYCPPRRRGPLGRCWHRHVARTQDCYWGYPEEFCEPPLGATVGRQLALQIAKGSEARMILYQYDFVEAAGSLKPRGKIQLAKIIPCLDASVCPIIIEASTDAPEIDEARRLTVLQELSQMGCAVPPERVIVARPALRGLDGMDAPLIDRNRGTQTGTRGVGASGNVSATGAGTGIGLGGGGGTSGRGY